MVTSDFRSEVKIRPFRSCALKNTQYNAYLWPNRRNSRVLKEIGVEEHDGDVRFQTGSGNIALSFMCHASGIIIGTVRSLIVDAWLWGRYHVPQNVFLVITVVTFRFHIYHNIPVAVVAKCQLCVGSMLICI